MTKTKCDIICDVHTRRGREWEITPDHRVWPCCFYANAWQLRDSDISLSKLFHQDQTLRKQFKKDPNWNSLDHYPLDTILTHDMLQSYIYKDGWNSDNPPPICVEECGVYYDEVTGKKTTKARLD